MNFVETAVFHRFETNRFEAAMFVSNEVVYETNNSTCMLYTTLTMCVCVTFYVSKQVNKSFLGANVLFTWLLYFNLLSSCFILIFMDWRVCV